MLSTSVTSLLSEALFVKSGLPISSQNIPPAAFGGVKHDPRQRLWLLTPSANGPPTDGSVSLLPSRSGYSLSACLRPSHQDPPLEPPVMSLPMYLETAASPTLLMLYHSTAASTMIWLPANGGSCGYPVETTIWFRGQFVARPTQPVMLPKLVACTVP